jgi:hypothetical protein
MDKVHISGEQMAKKKERRTFRQIFLDKLTDLSAGEQIFIGNKSLREALDWDTDKYDRIKSQLIGESAVILGRGQGGSVALGTAPGSRALKGFVSYSHVDEALKTELLKHLEPLRRDRLLESWSDRKLKAGDEWEATISQRLEDADVILLLVSIDFINSKYCYDIEVEKALERHEAGDAKVIPIILRRCLWSTTPFSRLQALPKDGKAVTAWSDRDEAFVNIAEGIREIAQNLLSGT